MTTTEPGMAITDDDDDEDDVDLHRMEAEVIIGGEHVDMHRAPPPCAHRQINTETQAALIMDDEDVIVKREVMLRAVCGECGQPFRLLPLSARESRQHGELGVVVEVELAE